MNAATSQSVPRPVASSREDLAAEVVPPRVDDTFIEHRAPENRSLRAHLAELFEATGDRLATLFFFTTMGALIVFGWRAHLERFITPEYGLGYLLGIVGGSLMLILLLYPLRKRWAKLRWMGSPRAWFRAHMMLGVLGPVCILYHCNYSLGALNSNVALFCMLIVAGSGMFGRYFYTRIHYGLYGAPVTRNQLRQDMEITRGRLADLFLFEPLLRTRLIEFEEFATRVNDGEFRTAARALSMGLRTHWMYAVAVPMTRRATLAKAASLDWSARKSQRHYRHTLRLVQVYLDVVRKLAQIGIFERLFSLWHLLHVPLFVMMVISAIAHVVAVHVF